MAKIKWTKETIIDDAKKYSTIKEWRLGSSSAYVVACRMKWNEEASAHMSRQKKKNFFWTDLKLKEEATKYQSTGEWSLSNPASYAAAKRKRLVPPEMKRDLMHGKWTKSNIKSAAETFRTRGEFRSELPSAYSIAASKGWLDELCSHMLDKAPWFGPRLIREYLLSHDIYFISEHKFREDSIVGRLPYDFYLPLHKMVIEYQGRQHKDGWGRDRLNAEDIQRRDKLKREYSERNGLMHIELDQTTRQSLISELEYQIYMAAQNNDLHFNPVARDLTEEEKERMVAPFKWTPETVRSAVKCCKSIKEFRANFPSAYGYALKCGIWEELSSELIRVKHHGKYTLGYVGECAKQCLTRSEFRIKHNGAWSAAQRNGWLDEVCSHMPKHLQRDHLRTQNGED